MERANRRESPRIAANRHRKQERIASESPLKHTRQSLPEWSLERGVGWSDDAVQGEGPCAKAWFSVGPIKSWELCSARYVGTWGRANLYLISGPSESDRAGNLLYIS